jgi:hypothetical protein
MGAGWEKEGEASGWAVAEALATAIWVTRVTATPGLKSVDADPPVDGWGPRRRPGCEAGAAAPKLRSLADASAFMRYVPLSLFPEPLSRGLVPVVLLKTAFPARPSTGVLNYNVH